MRERIRKALEGAKYESIWQLDENDQPVVKGFMPHHVDGMMEALEPIIAELEAAMDASERFQGWLKSPWPK